MSGPTIAATSPTKLKSPKASPIMAGAVTRSLSNRGLDVLIEAEQVRRVIFVLQSNQPSVGLTIVRRPNPVLKAMSSSGAVAMYSR